MNDYSVRFPNGEIHGAPTFVAALKYAARATREGRPAAGVYKGSRKLATCQSDYKVHRVPRRRPGYAAKLAITIAACKLLKAGKFELQRTKRR